MQFFFVVFLCFLVVSVSGTDHSAEDLKEFLLHHNHVVSRDELEKTDFVPTASASSPPAQASSFFTCSVWKTDGRTSFDDPHEGLKEVCCRQQKCTDQFVTDSVCCSRFKKYEQFF
ncbi:hypothetical protein QR680_008350 [Steinernema hermaphroditum]|uniref:Insulin-like domain-containing protein n=1 Tax=Steinernema hermaphroditum TaxID=289476 RepID=A0AA39M6W1_9BILA|nr:hypothetical protein QR680_008350 [Steinernema hermaphroditum]